MLGDFAIGKTSLTNRYVRQTFSEKYLTTVGVKVDSKSVELPDQTTIKLVIWDIAGSDKDTFVDANYLKGAAGIILVADGCRLETYENMLRIQSDVNEKIGACPVVFAINKLDLINNWEVTDEHIAQLSDSGCPVFKTSAKTGDNVESVFLELAQLIFHS